MKVSLVVGTVGRADALARLFASLARQTLPVHEVIVVEQGDGEACAALVAAAPFPARHVRLARRGLSRARNAGWRLASGDVIGFPDDDCTYPPTLLAQVAAIFAADAGLTALTGRTVDESGQASVTRTDAQSGRVTRRNVWRRCVEPAMFIRADAPARFDPRLGVGARTPRQAYEGPDLALRLLREGARITYRADLQVLHDDVLARIGPRELARAEGYGRGHGFVLAKHAGVGAVGVLTARSVAAATVRWLRGERGRAAFSAIYARAAWAGGWDRVRQRARVRARRRVVRSSGAVAVGRVGGAAALQGIGMALRYLTALLLTAWLTPAAFGTFAWTTAALAIAVWLPLQGRGHAAQRFLPGYGARGEVDLAAAFVTAGRAVTLRSGVALAALTSAAAWTPWWPADALATTIGAWTLPAMASAAFDAGVLRALGRTRTALTREHLLAPLATLALMALLHGYGAVGALGANALGVTVLALALRHAAGASEAARAPVEVRSAWRRAGWSLLIGKVAHDAVARADVIMVGLLLGAETAGVAHLASRTGALLLIVTYAVSMVTTPQLAALAAVGDHVGWMRMRGVAQRLSFFPSAALAVMAIAIAPTLFGALGGAYAAAVVPLIVLAVGYALMAAFGPVAALLEVSGGQAITARAWLAAVPLALALHAWAIPAFGVLGAALASVTTGLLVTTLLAVAVARRSVALRREAAGEPPRLGRG